MTETLEQMLIRHEGLKLKPYHCPAGKLTIGVGRNLEDNGITQGEAMEFLKNDIDNAYISLSKILSTITLKDLVGVQGVRLNVLIDMIFNLGETRFRQFHDLIAAVKAQDWEAAAKAMQASKWYAQVGQRGVELVWMMREGKAWEA